MGQEVEVEGDEPIGDAATGPLRLRQEIWAPCFSLLGSCSILLNLLTKLTHSPCLGGVVTNSLARRVGVFCRVRSLLKRRALPTPIHSAM